ncbi:orotate phosphoribosyltransferase [Stygiolobus caldivivus]|uniref:Orotate phosphoribosyltransferase n=1 Tax=Stygiolobus caldivivus TaxID=2824673 RepID=A0A8D5U8W2_9CREN|nr:orotate phosphoribosyltransferase [Stygiolobus caldivivus]BCU71382.1 orotate phosphoribosyltransferase [Stygiolobus caldivivus]
MDFAKNLLEKRLLLIGNFILTSGKVSPYYLDLRRLPNYPEIFSDVTNKAIQLLKGIEFDMILGIATGGVPFASFLACKLMKPLGYIRSEKKGYGTDRLIEADVQNKEVIIVDDVVTTGGSILKAIEEVRKAGGIVNYALAIVDRQEGASKRLKNVDVELISVYKISEILNYLLSSELVSESDKKVIKDYLVSNIE